jgi:diguanylate cyclase (GGDEF)-like protein
LEEILDLLVAAKKRYNHPFSVAVVVIDHFQRICESCGDAVAKPLLRAVARLIEQSIRKCDLVARYRDDAFVVVMTQTELAGAEAFCRRLHEAARQNTKLDIKLRISTGAASAEVGEDAATLLARADAAVG